MRGSVSAEGMAKAAVGVRKGSWRAGKSARAAFRVMTILPGSAGASKTQPRPPAGFSYECEYGEHLPTARANYHGDEYTYLTVSQAPGAIAVLTSAARGSRALPGAPGGLRACLGGRVRPFA